LNKQQLRIGGIAAALGLAALATDLHATDGYFQTGYGPIQKSLAGGGVADSEDATSIAINPAGLVDVGQQLNASLTFFTGFPEYSASGTGLIAPGSASSNKNFYPLPVGAYSQPIDGDSSFGVALYGNGGIGTTYNIYNPNTKSGGVFGGGTTGAEFIQTFVSVGYAHRFGNVSIGVAPILSIQRLDAWGLAPFEAFSESPLNVTNQGNDWGVGIGVRAGVGWNVAPGWHLAVAGASAVATSKFQSYSGLIADQGNLNAPGNITAGIAWDATPPVTFLFDYKHIFYSGVGFIGNSSLIPPLLGSSGGPGLGWRDVNVFTLSGEWRVAPALTLRAGYAYNTQPIRSSDIALNILAPAIVQNHIGAGFSWNFLDSQSIDVGAIYAPRQIVSGPVSPSFGGGSVNLSLWVFEATVGYIYKFDTSPAALVAKY